MSARPSLTPRLLSNIFLFAAVFISLAPLSLVAINAFKSHAEIVANPLSLPHSLNPANFINAWVGGQFNVGLFNSAVITGTAVIVTIACAALVAFPLARQRVPFWRLLTLYFLLAVTMPIQLFLFPLYFIYAQLGLTGDSVATAFILAAINLPLAILLLRTYVLTIPVELDEAALMEGARPWQIFRHIVLPLMRPGLITVAFIVGLNAFNEYLVTSTFQTAREGKTMVLGLLSMSSVNSPDAGTMMAGTAIVIVPILILFLLLQRLFIAGMTAGALRG